MLPEAVKEVAFILRRSVPAVEIFNSGTELVEV